MWLIKLQLNAVPLQLKDNYMCKSALNLGAINMLRRREREMFFFPPSGYQLPLELTNTLYRFMPYLTAHEVPEKA